VSRVLCNACVRGYVHCVRARERSGMTIRIDDDEDDVGLDEVFALTCRCIREIMRGW